MVPRAGKGTLDGAVGAEGDVLRADGRLTLAVVDSGDSDVGVVSAFPLGLMGLFH